MKANKKDESNVGLLFRVLFIVGMACWVQLGNFLKLYYFWSNLYSKYNIETKIFNLQNYNNFLRLSIKSLSSTII